MSDKQPDIVTCVQEFFTEIVEEGLSDRKMETHPLVPVYLSEMLKNFMSIENLYEADDDGKLRQRTLAEQYLEALSPGVTDKFERLKRLGDSSLYISGFFGDSLKRKIIDIDYYAEIGGSAYSALASHVEEETFVQVYGEFSGRFLEFVDVLTYISQKALIQTNKDILRLYDRYIETGSELAKEQLLKKGILTASHNKKRARQ